MEETNDDVCSANANDTRYSQLLVDEVLKANLIII